MAAKRKVGVLTREQIMSEGVITADTFLEKCVQAASYSLRLGNDYYVPQSSLSNDDRNRPITEGDISHCEGRNNVLIIPSYSSVVFSTEEELNMPNNVIGRFDLRPKWAMQGLVLQVGTQVEPGYKGRLFGLLLNFSSDNIPISRNESLLAIEFHYLSGIPTLTDKDKKEYKTLFDFFGRNATPVKGALEEFQKQMKETNDIIEQRLKLIGDTKTERQRRNATNLIGGAGIAVALIIPIMLFSLTKATYDRGSFPLEIIEELRENNELLKQDNEILRQNFHDMEAKIDSLALRNNEVADTVK